MEIVQFVKYRDEKKRVSFRPIGDIRRITERKDGDYDVLFGTDIRHCEHEVLTAEEINAVVPYTMIAVSDPSAAFQSDDDEEEEDEEE